MWTISFDVVVSLAASGHQDSTALASSVETTLADGSLESAIEANLGVSVTVDQSSIILVQTTTVAPTLNPMPAQTTTVAPTLNPMIAQAKKRAEIGSIVIVIAVVVFAILLALLAGFWYGRKSGNHDVNGAFLEAFERTFDGEATVERTFDGSQAVIDLKLEATPLPEIEGPVDAKVLRQKVAQRRNSGRDEGIISFLMAAASPEVMEIPTAEDDYTLGVRSTTL